jgi:hypothetical protein
MSDLKNTSVNISGAGTYYSEPFSIVNSNSVAVEVIPSSPLIGGSYLLQDTVNSFWGSALNSLGAVASGSLTPSGSIIGCNELEAAMVRLKLSIMQVDMLPPSGVVDITFFGKVI